MHLSKSITSERKCHNEVRKHLGQSGSESTAFKTYEMLIEQQLEILALDDYIKTETQIETQ